MSHKSRGKGNNRLISDHRSRDKVHDYFKERGWKIEDLGFNRSPIRTYQLPLRIRMLPDFLVQKDEVSWLVEIKGCSRALRLKLISLFGIMYWDGELPLRLAVYDSSVDHVFIFSCDEIRKLIAETKPKVEIFHNNQEPYLRIKMPRDLMMRFKELFRRLF